MSAVTPPAHELAPHELLPSPTWEVMCSEMEWPV